MQKIKFIKPISPETMIPAGPIGVREGEVKTEQVTLNLSKIDAAWKEDIFSYSGPGGMDRKPHKVSGVREWLSKQNEVYSPIIYITNDDPKNLFFVDGRHTTAHLIESGYKEAIFIIPTNQTKTILNAFG